MVTKIITGAEINMDEKQISNPYSAGQGGPHFENRVQSAFTILLLIGGVAPCLPQWPIVEIKLQGKYQGYNIDDLIVHCQKPNSERRARLLGQIKHKIKFTFGDQILSEVISAAWNDFTNPKIFSESSQDALALICGPLSAIDTDSVRTLLEQARYSKNGEDLKTRIELGQFTSNEQREKFNVFKYHLKNANNNVELTNDQLWRFLKSFHLLIYDLDIKGVVLSLLHSLIEQYSRNNASSVWTQINDHVQWVNENAGSITLDTIPEEMRNIFQKIQREAIPEEFFKDTTKTEITDWNDYENAPDLAIACLVGSWNENSSADKSILSQLAGMKYEIWIPKLRNVLQYPESPLELKNGIWFVKDRIKLFQSLGARIFDDHLDTFKKCLILVLTERNPKFELPKKDQFAAQIYGKILNYSNHLRRGLSEGLALISCYAINLKNCSTNKPEIAVVLAIREIFQNSDWVLWASLNDLLPTLAEAAHDEFLKIVEDKLKDDANLFKELFAQEGDGVTGWNYMTGLLWALESLAWSETFLVRATIVLGELAKIDPGGNWVNRPLNSLTTIFLPWLPQTTASIEKRKVAIATLDKEQREISWKLLLTLLPRKHQVSSGAHKPKFRDYILKENDGKVSNKDYWEQTNFYSELAVEKAKDDISKLNELVKNLDNLPQPSFEKLLAHLSSEKIIKQPDEIKTSLWNALVDFITKHKRFSDAKWALSKEVVSKIELVANKLDPKNPLYLYARLFSSRDVDLFEERGNWDEQHKKLSDRREQAIKVILNDGGISAVLDFLNNVDSQTNVGYALGAIADDAIDKKILPVYIDTNDKKLSQFIRAYVWRKYYNNGWEWVDKMLSKQWTKVQIADFLTFLPFILDTWKRVTERLADSEFLYWERTYINPYQSDSDLTPAIDKLIEFGRPHAALDCINKILYDKKPFDKPRAVKALLAGITSKESSNVMDVHNITEVIKVLQEDGSVSEDDLFRIEWGYLQLLDGYNGVSPKYLGNRLANDSSFFCEVIQKIYRSKKTSAIVQEPAELDKAIATRAWELLYHWQTPPGTRKDNQFDGEQFTKWLNEVKRICDESGHLEVALSHIGKVLFYAPEDASGFWIQKIVAEELNKKEVQEMRNGFSSEVYNSRGTYWVDPTGKPEIDLAKTYRKKSDETENAGFQRLAVTLRKIAESYEEDAKRIIEEHQRENEGYSN